MSFTSQATDFTGLWCDLFFEELFRCGVRHICLAPGSRSAPLALAASRHPQLSCHSHFDERGLGFLALGLARGLAQPVALVTTSGTAVANLYPALQEAREAGVSLVVISADRPPELLGCGANQTLNQNGIFADCPVQSLALPVPSMALSARWLLSSIDQAIAAVTGPDGGIVHFNQALREPLYGDGSELPETTEWLAAVTHWQQVAEPLCCWHQGLAQSPLPSLPEGQVVVVAGAMAQQDAQALAALVQATGWLLIADIQSGLHGHPLALSCADLVLGHPEAQARLESCRLVIQCGRRTISKRLGQWLAAGVTAGQNREHWYVDERTDRHDPWHSVSRRLVMGVASFCHQLQEQIASPKAGSAPLQSLLNSGQAVADYVREVVSGGDQLHEIWAAMETRNLAREQQLFIGNSMPVRWLDSLSAITGPESVWVNRGISGIDGLIATAAGHALAKRAQGCDQRTVLLIGDLSLLHDLNSLQLAQACGLIVVLLNNSGGSIFNLFPIADADARAQLFRVEHKLSAAGAAGMFGLDYHQPGSREQFQSALQQALVTPGSALIEVLTPAQQGTDLFRQLYSQIQGLPLC